MAVNTAQRRYSMINFGDGANTPLVFQPDGAVDADDRQMLLGLYSMGDTGTAEGKFRRSRQRFHLLRR